jgi:16S rRNA G527 N7-methylase RsmG
MRSVRRIEECLEAMEELLKEIRSIALHSVECHEEWIEKERKVLEEDKVLRETEKL